MRAESIIGMPRQSASSANHKKNAHDTIIMVMAWINSTASWWRYNKCKCQEVQCKRRVGCRVSEISHACMYVWVSFERLLTISFHYQFARFDSIAFLPLFFLFSLSFYAAFYFHLDEFDCILIFCFLFFVNRSSQLPSWIRLGHQQKCLCLLFISLRSF